MTINPMKLIASIALLASAALAQTVVTSPPGIYPSGQAVAVIEASYNASASSASIASTNLTCISPNQNAVSTSPQAGIQTSANIVAPTVQCPAGVYRMTVMEETTLVGGATVTFTPGWHSGLGAQGAAGYIVGTLTMSSTNIIPASATVNSLTFFHDGTSQISFLTTFSGTGAYNLHVLLERLQ